MTPDSVGPLSRPFPLHRIKPEAVDVVVEATAEERAQLAADFGLPSILALEGRFRVSGTADRVRVVGVVSARIEQICVITLDRFESLVDEEVELEFQPEGAGSSHGSTLDLDLDHDPLEELTGDRIDLGAVTAEFLALGLDPYPRKPGVAFDPPAGEATADSPFAELGQLQRKAEGG